MKLREKNGVKHLYFETFDKYGVSAIYSTRVGGVSLGVYESMNLGFHLDDDWQNVYKNFELFADSIGRSLDDFVLSKQVHGDLILDLTVVDRGANVVRPSRFDEVDGFITSENSLVLCTVYADCVPVYFYDTKTGVFGICHSGWRGTAKNIAGKMIEQFVEKGSNVEDIIAGIGPSICGKCIEVMKDVVDELDVYSYANKHYVYREDVNRYYVDLRGIIREHLMAKGLNSDNIEVSDDCTYENNELFFSHRRDGRNRGSQLGLIYKQK